VTFREGYRPNLRDYPNRRTCNRGRFMGGCKRVRGFASRGTGVERRCKTRLEVVQKRKRRVVC